MSDDMIKEDYSTPRVSRFRLHINGDHSQCLFASCSNRQELEYATRDYILNSLARGVSDETIEQAVRAKYPDWIVDYVFPDIEVIRFESHYVLRQR